MNDWQRTTLTYYANGKEMSVPRRIAQIVFGLMGVVTFVLAVAPLLQPFALPIIWVSDWNDPEIRRIVGSTFLFVFSAIAFEAAAFFLKNAKTRVLILLTVLNALVLTGVWYFAGGKDLLFLPPLSISLVSLLFEDYRALSLEKGKMA